MSFRRNVSLGPSTTLGVGGPANHFVEANSVEEIIDHVRAADAQAARAEQVLILGGGSNLLVSDDGFPGWVVAVRNKGIHAEGGDVVSVQAAAGEPWDELVAWTVTRGLSGLECLAGIPGTVGATPIQNVGAYGQEIADTFVSLSAWDRQDGTVVTLPRSSCGFGYRRSVFKHALRHRYVVLSARFALTRGPPAKPRQGELARRLDALGREPSSAEVRDIVIELRRGKGMVYDPADPDTCSAGSFFLNPVVSLDHARHIEQGVSVSMPRYPHGPRRVKLAAAWLIEQAGFGKGYSLGKAGLSTRHCLALSNRGGASAQEILALARRVRHGVSERFGVLLEPEPLLVNLAL